jgi:isopenicillin-N N-acyltransferase-like protein
MRTLHLEGAPRAMGEAHGEALRDATRELAALRIANALAQARTYGGRDASEADLLRLAQACCAPWRRYDPDGFAELEGIARGADLSLEHVIASNGLTDLRDALAWGGEPDGEGCTAFLVQRDAAADGRLWCGQTWDLASDNAPFVVAVERRPREGPSTRCVTTAGCLSLMGLNEHGLALGTTNLRTRDAGPGVPYLGVIHRALRERSCAGAVEWIERAPRAGAHAYLVADAAGAAAAVECTGRLARVIPVERGFHVHTNHCLVPEHRALEGPVPLESSRARHARMTELLGARAGRLDEAALRGFLADGCGALAICRDGFDGISTNAAWVACPELPRAVACAGLPSRGAWIDLLAA